MTTPKEVFVGIDVAKLRNAVAIADAGRDGEIRYLGEFDAAPESMKRLITRLAAKYERMHFCCEAGPTGIGFSWAVSGMMMPPVVLSSALSRRMTTRSCKGRKFIDLLLTMAAHRRRDRDALSVLA